MKSQPSSSKVSRKPFMLRRVYGGSMLPTLKPGQLIVATRLLPVRSGDVVVAIVDGREVIKRVLRRADDSIELAGDNKAASTDSRTYGVLPKSCLYGRVIFTTPRKTA